MRAVLFDIHGNLPALEAVLADAEGAGARGHVLGGDYTLFGAWPRETLARLRELDAEWIRGNGERWTAAPGEAPDAGAVQAAIAHCRELLGEQQVIELAEMPDQRVSGGVRYCHASPISDVRGFSPGESDHDAELIDGAGERRLVFGHTHLQFRRSGPAGIELVNPGSVGMPFDGDTRAAYALLHDDGRLEPRRVAYDVAESAGAVRARLPEPVAETIARRLEQARFDAS